MTEKNPLNWRTSIFPVGAQLIVPYIWSGGLPQKPKFAISIFPIAALYRPSTWDWLTYISLTLTHWKIIRTISTNAIFLFSLFIIYIFPFNHVLIPSQVLTAPSLDHIIEQTQGRQEEICIRRTERQNIPIYE